MVTIDDHAVKDPTEEDFKDRSGGEDIVGPLEVALMEHEQPIMEHEHESIGNPLEGAPLKHVIGGEDIMGEPAPSTGVTSSPLMLRKTNQSLEEHFHGLHVLMETRFNQVENMLREQSRIAKYVDQLDKKVKKLIDVLTKSVSDVNYCLNLLHGDMETMLIHTQDLVEKIDQSRKVVANSWSGWMHYLGSTKSDWGKGKCGRNGSTHGSQTSLTSMLTLSLLPLYLIN
ncbi:hypothetical protein Syun_023528 [Stephania yunnanensis]|uniref:Uncharacterized protein n=1 Tax=Stephania yunnanensis TaxID=152371 RepID=A0AAP0I2B2_9MAGN